MLLRHVDLRCGEVTPSWRRGMLGAVVTAGRVRRGPCVCSHVSPCLLYSPIQSNSFSTLRHACTHAYLPDASTKVTYCTITRQPTSRPATASSIVRRIGVHVLTFMRCGPARLAER